MDKKTKNYLIWFLIIIALAGAGWLAFISGSKEEFQKEPQDLSLKNDPDEPEVRESVFLGNRGSEVKLENGKIEISAVSLDDGIAKFYNVEMPSGKIIYFFAVKDRFGTYRAAANGCAICFGQRKGFHQEQNQIVCDNCGNRYPLEKIATEKGGCNPGPINPDLKVVGEKIIIKEAELEQVADLF